MSRKPLETSNRFRVTCEVETQHMGPLIEKLTLMGLNKISFELVTDVVTYKRNNVESGMTAIQTVCEMAKQVPSFSKSDARNYLREHGRSVSNITKVLRTLVQKKMLSITDGVYSATSMLHEPQTKMLPAPTAQYNGLPRTQIILQYALSGSGDFSTGQIKQVLVENGYAPKTAYGILHTLLKRKLVKRTDVGMYRLTSKARMNGVEGSFQHNETEH